MGSGQGSKKSQYNITLQGSEDVEVYVYNNYTMGGSYVVIANATNGQYIDYSFLDRHL